MEKSKSITEKMRQYPIQVNSKNQDRAKKLYLGYIIKLPSASFKTKTPITIKITPAPNWR